MYETQIHQPIYIWIYFGYTMNLDSNTNILSIAVNVQVLMTLEYIHVVLSMS